MNQGRGFLLSVVAILVASAGFGGEAAHPAGGWTVESQRDHPLAGRIWDVREGRFLERTEAVARMAAARVVILGEKHDNPDHHTLQAEVLASLVELGRRPAVAFEQFDGDQAAALQAFLADAVEDAAGLGAAVGWEHTGWPPWSVYQPIADIAVRHSLPILAANLPARVARAISRSGLSAVSQEVADLGLEAELPEEVDAAMRREIMDSHCGMAVDAMMAPMVLVQRARDARMAQATAQGAAMGDGAVLIAGFGHARNDRAVPALLPATADPVVSLAFLEVVAGRDDPPLYAGEQDGTLPFDLVWFTPRLDDEDPCEKFRDRLEKIRRRAPRSEGEDDAQGSKAAPPPA